MFIVTKPQANHKLRVCVAVNLDPHEQVPAYLRT